MTERMLLFVRHAESIWNAERRWQGWGDPRLSERGLEQAAALAARLGGDPVEAIVSSDLRRALETAQILADALGVGVRTDLRLRERDIGRWSGLREAEIAALDPADLVRLRSGDPGVRPGGGESEGEFAARVAPALSDLAEAAGRFVVVTHLGVIRRIAPWVRPANADAVEVPVSALRAAS
ncbi:putative phosphoglycerate mutase [Myxococcaceae bacterium]|jgi:broad specificity phosphatase PhoE|nr:putative phosphoglycerate mutase [Myxococcaceae bacterium]